MSNWLDASEQSELFCPRQRTPANPVVSEADSGIPAVCVDRGDIQHSGIGYEPPGQPMPTTSCAMAATRV